MKNQHFRPVYYSNFTILFFALGFIFSSLQSQEGLSLKILDDSKLYIEGKSNVNKFSCHCTEEFPITTVQYNGTPSNSTAHFNKTEMKITTAKLDCGKKAINKDLQAALKADEFPSIKLELCSLTFPEAAHSDEWQKVKAETFLTIAGTTRTVDMIVQAKQLGDNKYKIISSKEIKMTDFGIDPPTALLGLVQVKDDITLNFDLNVEIRNFRGRHLSDN